MKKQVGLWQFAGFAITALGGTILHFLFEWLGRAAWIAPFSGVNESTWEHMKLLFWPMFLFAIVQSFFFKDFKCFWRIKARGIILGLIMIPILFYTFNGIFGKSPDWYNIAIFFVCAAIAFIYETKYSKMQSSLCRSAIFPICILSAIAILFIVFTFWTPKLKIFMDPITGSFGIL